MTNQIRSILAFLLFATAAFSQALSSNNGVNVIGALPAGTNVIGHVITDSGSVVAATLSAETTKVIGVVRTADGAGNLLTSTANALDVNIKTSSISITSTVNNTVCSGTQRNKSWIAVPTSSTAVTSTDACLTAITFTNTNSSTQTVTVTDGQGSPVTIVATYVIPANSTVTFPFYGSKAITGFKWVAGGTGVTGGATWVE